MNSPISLTPKRKTNLLTFIRSEIAARRQFGGELSFLSTCSRLMLVLLNWRAHGQVVRAINGPYSRRILESYPRVVYRYTLPYLSSVFSRKERINIITGHYDFMNKSLSDVFFSASLQGSLVLWERTIEENSLSISIGGPCPDREGEITLIFKLDARPLYKMAFSMLDVSMLPVHENDHAASSSTQAVYAIYIGQVQGYPGEFESIRKSTKMCAEVAPADMLMSAIFGIASSLGIEIIAGVDYHQCLTVDKIIKSGTKFNISDFWEKYHFIKTENGHHVLKLPFIDKPISAIKANHRGRTLLKRQFKNQISTASASAMASMVTKKIQTPV